MESLYSVGHNDISEFTRTVQSILQVIDCTAAFCCTIYILALLV